MARKKRYGFTLIEAMVTVGVLGCVAALATNWWSVSVFRAHRAEAFVTLGEIAAAQSAHWVDNKEYATDFDELGYKPPGVATKTAPDTYELRWYSIQMSQPDGVQGWSCTASADLDGDVWPDQVVAYEAP